jgi:hypothetical protein
LEQFLDLKAIDFLLILTNIYKSVVIKNEIVSQDPTEKIIIELVIPWAMPLKVIFGE